MKTRSWLAKFKSAWAITPSKIVKSKFQKPHAHLHIIGRKSMRFQVNPMKDVEGVAETRSLGWTAGQMERQTDGIAHTRMDKGHFCSPPLPTSGDKNWDC